jgi:cytochrome P450 PksS
MADTRRPQYELKDPAVLADPHPLYHRMRREDPVHWSASLGAWFLTAHDDVQRCLRDPRLSSRRTDSIIGSQLPAADRALAADYARLSRGMMLFQDGEDHHRLRIIGNHAFTPTALDRFRPVVQEVVDDLLDRVAGRAGFDVARDLAQPLPAVVIARMFDIAPGDRNRFQEWADAAATFFGGTLGDPAEGARAANAAALNLEGYFRALLAERRRHPGDDLMSLLIRGQDEGRLTAEEVCCQCIMLLTGGHVTTIDQFGNAVYALLSHPAELAKLRDNPALIRSAVEEAVRYDGAVGLARRVAAEDVEVRGRVIRAGDLVFLSVAAANRDPEVFPDPDRFDVARAGNRHIGFGAGPHVCIGSGLARRELEVGLAALLRRFPGLRLADEPPRRRCETLVFRGFHALPVAV